MNSQRLHTLPLQKGILVQVVQNPLPNLQTNRYYGVGSTVETRHLVWFHGGELVHRLYGTPIPKGKGVGPSGGSYERKS